MNIGPKVGVDTDRKTSASQIHRKILHLGTPALYLTVQGMMERRELEQMRLKKILIKERS